MKKVLGYSLYGLAIIILGFYFIVDLIPTVMIEEVTRLFILGISCLLIYFGGFSLAKHYKNNKAMKINLWIYFILYVILFLTLTLFDMSWGRRGFYFSLESFKYLKESVNLIPFKTIYEYLIQNFNNLTDTRTIFYNVFGNLVALMPMAFFLTLLFKKQNKFGNFLLTIFLIDFSVEFIQLFTSVGRFDIDDIILNVLGALIMFGFLKIKTVNNLIKNIFLLEKNKIDKKKLFIIFSILGIICLSFIGLIKYHDCLYQNNIDIIHYQMEIIDDSNNCIEELDKFYETDLYNYYFPCQKSNSVYALINNKDKYLVKDLLNNNPSPYDVDIAKIEEIFEIQNISYIKENKYEYVPFNVKIPVKDNSYSSPDVKVIIDDEDILNYKLDVDRSKFVFALYSVNLHLIPKSKGETNLKITFSDSDSNTLLEEDNYKIVIDKDLQVKYTKIES